MRAITLASCLALTVGSLPFAAGCIEDDLPPSTVRPTDPSSLLVYRLSSPSAAERRDASVELTRRREFSAEGAISEALRRESDARAARAELYFLAGTGSPTARDTIIGYLNVPDPDVAQAASDALTLWSRYAPYYRPGQSNPVATAAPQPAAAPQAQQAAQAPQATTASPANLPQPSAAPGGAPPAAQQQPGPSPFAAPSPPAPTPGNNADSEDNINP